MNFGGVALKLSPWSVLCNVEGSPQVGGEAFFGMWWSMALQPPGVGGAMFGVGLVLASGAPEGGGALAGGGPGGGGALASGGVGAWPVGGIVNGGGSCVCLSPG